MGSKPPSLSEKDTKSDSSDRGRIPLVRIIEPEETLTPLDLAEPEVSSHGDKVKVMLGQDGLETDLVDEADNECDLSSSGESSKRSMFLRVPLALKFGCHSCMQTMKQKYLRHFHRNKRLPLTGLPSIP
ncbi:hypothetical protein ElyMa_001237700, partial [Elysia marginata]